MRMKESINCKVILINDRIYGPSVGYPVKSFLEYNGDEKSLYTFIYDKKNIALNIEGNKLLGIYPPFTSGWYLNTAFQDIIFRKFKNFLKENSRSSLIHYTSQQVKPFRVEHSTVTVHDLVPVLFPEQTRTGVLRLTKRNLEFYRTLPVVSAVSNFTKTTMEVNGFSGKIHVVPNTVSGAFKPLKLDKLELRKKLNLPPDKRLILSVSANYPRKNLGIVRKTVELLGREYALVRVGPSIEGSIVFNNVNEETLNEIYNACDVFFTASSYEGFGLPVLEAMSSGIPVVASDIEIFREVTDGAAILTEINPKFFKRGIEEAISNKDRFISAGLERVKHYSFENFARCAKIFYDDATSYYGL